ncbi:WbqC family protein [Haloterrigena alkaliphila]|uniref:WbqC family protein n=1 Tax=Haloterrigena alkaliphila TaxID=2816475 RepID=A0A8A2VPJ7_9EURY|nr:WbqC family protein [Haloterrigena alkaliphila]QSX00029.1 WbqC family protein [Haloterrigena alkaliphila]
MPESVAIYQPRYYPRLHYLARASQSDVFVLLDDVEFSRRSRQHRAELSLGSQQWLTIPVKHENDDVLLTEAEIDTSSRFAEKHYGTLQHKYGSDAEILKPFYEGVDDRQVLRLVEITVPTLLEMFDRFDVDTEVVRSSELDVDRPRDASEYLARLVDAVGGSTYISGETGYENYLEEEPFERRDLDVAVQQWTPEWEDGNVCCLEVLFESSSPREHVEANPNPSIRHG